MTEEQIGERLHHAVDSRVNSVLGSTPVSTPPLAMHSRGRARSKVVALAICALTILGVGVRQGIQVAQNEKTEEVVVARDTTAARGSEPRMVLRSSEYVPGDYRRIVPDPLFRDSVQLTSKSTEIHLYMAEGQPFGGSTGGTKPIQIGSAVGSIRHDKQNWMIGWSISEFAVAAWGRGPLEDELVGALGRLRVGGDQKFAMESIPKGFRVKRVTQGSGYNADYRKPNRPGLQDSVQLSVLSSTDGSDGLDGDRTAAPVNRNGRSYSLAPQPPVTTEPIQQFVSWREGNFVVSISAPGSAEEVLALADQVQPATTAEWKALLRTSTDETTKGVHLKRGQIDDELGTRFTLEADADGAPGECRTIALRWVDHALEACVKDDSKELVRVLRVTNVEGMPVVFGVLSNASPENQVVRVTDAEGDVVGEEVAYDALSIKGRAFAFPLDKRAVAPFTVEIFDFDRAWYSENFEKLDDAQTFVSDEAEPILQLPVSLENTPPL
jgi:hypothetical protein